MTFTIKQHDLEPSLVIDISGSAGDLNGVVSWRVIGKRGSTVVFDDGGPDHVVGSPATSATITHHWAGTETSVAGWLQVEVEATWPSSRKQTFPPIGYVTVYVDPDLA